MFIDLGTIIVKLTSWFGELKSVIFLILMYFNMSKKYPFDLASLIFGPKGINNILKGLGKIKSLLHGLRKTEAPLGLYPPGLPAPQERLGLPAAQTSLVPAGPTSLTPTNTGSLMPISQMSEEEKTNFFTNMIKNAQMAAQNIWKLFINMINKLKLAASGVFTNAFNTVKSKIGSFTNQIKKSYYNATNQAYITDESGKVKKADIVDRRISVYEDSGSSDAKTASRVSQMWQNHMARLRDSIGRVKQDISTVWQHHNERVVQSVQYASAQFNKLKASATSTFDKISSVTSNVANGIRNTYGKAADSIRTQTLSIRNAFVKATSKAYMTDETGKVHRAKVLPTNMPTTYEQPEQSYNKINEAINRIKTNLHNTVENGKWMFEDLAARVGYQFNKIKTNIGSAVSGTFNNIRSNVESSFNNTVSSVSTAFNKIKSQFGGFTNKVKASYYNATNQPYATYEDGKVRKAEVRDPRMSVYEQPEQPYSKFTATAKKVSDEVNRIWKQHLTNLNGSFKTIQNEFTRVWNNHKARVADSVAHTKSQFASMAGGISTQFATIRGKFSTAFSGITNIAQTVSTKIKSVFGKISEPIVSGFQKATTKMKGFASDVSKAFKERLGYTQTPISTEPSMFDSFAQVQGKKLSMYDGGMTESSTAAIIDTANQKAQQGQGVFQKYITTMKGGNDALKAYLASLNGGNATMAGYNKFLQEHNAGVKASGVAAKLAGIGHMFLNAALSMGVSFILSTAISAITSLVNKNKELAESAKEAMTEIENMRKELKENYDTIQEIKDDYEGLASGVDSLGRNISLSTDEYDRYNEIVNQIASMFPEMVAGYTEEGNAIISLKGDVEALEEAYKKEAEAARDATLIKQNDVFDNFKNNTNKQKFSWLQMGKVSQTDKLSFFEEIMSGTSVSDWEEKNKDIDGSLIDTWLEEAGIKDTNWYSDDADFDKAIKENIKSVQAYYNILKTQMEAEASSVRTILNAYLQQDWDYLQMSDQGKQIAQSIISGFDTEFYSQFDSAAEMEAWVTTNVIQPLQNTANLEQVELAFDLQTKFNNGQITVDEYIKQIEEMLKQLEPILGKKIVTNLRTVFGVEEENGTYETKKNSAKNILDSDGDKKVGTLSKEDLNIIDKNKTKWQEDLKVDGKTVMSWEELTAKIAEAKAEATDAAAEWKNASEAIDSIQEAYDTLTDVVKQYNSTGYLTLDNLQALLSLEPEYLTCLQMENGQLSFNQQAMEALLQTQLAKAEATVIDTAITQLNTLSEQAKADAIVNSSNAAGNAVPVLSTYASQLSIVGQEAIVAAGKVAAFNAAVDGAVAAGVSLDDVNAVISGMNAQFSAIKSVRTNLSTSFNKIVSPGSSGSSSKEKTPLEKIQEKYERKIKDLEGQQTYIENEIEKLEAKDEGVSADYYEKQIELEEEKIALYQQEREELLKLERTDEVADAIWEVEHAIQESTLSLIEFRKAISELYATASERITEAYDRKGQLFDDQTSFIENEISIRETKGELIPTSAYDELITEAQSRRSNAEAELNAQADLYWQGIQQNGEEWASSDEALDIIEKIRQKKLDMQESDKQIAEYVEQQKDAYIAYYDKMMEMYNYRNDFFSLQSDFAQSYIDRLGVLNINVPDEAYEKIAEIQELSVAGLKEQLAFANSELAKFEEQGIDKNDPRYIEKFNEALTLEKEIYDKETDIYEIHQQIFDNKIDRFNQVIDRINDATQKLENVSGLLEREDVATEDGEWTAEGITRLGIAYQLLEYYEQTADEVAKKMAEVEEAYKRGEISEKTYYETMQDLEDQQWDAINSAEDMKDTIIDLNEARIDMIEQGLDKEIEAYQELIDLKKETLDAERDLYDFKKNVEKQAKDIAALERRIASMSGSTDSSTIAERTKLEAELREAKDSLDDSYRDHAYDSISNALDSDLDSYTTNAKNYIEHLRESIKETDLLIEQTYQNVLQNTDIVLETITTKADEYGFQLDGYLTEPWKNATSASIDFDTYATQHFDAVYENVETKTSELTGYTKAPWEDGESQAKTFSLEAQRYMTQEVVEYAEKYYKEQLKSALNYPWEQANGQASWGTGIKEILDQAVEDAEEAGKKIAESLAVESPSYEGTGSGNSGTGNTKTTPTTTKSPTVATIKNANIGSLQTILKYVFGYDLGSGGPKDDGVDGIYGSKTKEAVRKMENLLKTTTYKIPNRSKITVDGLYDAHTKQALETYLKLNASMRNKALIAGVTPTFLPKAIYAKGTTGTTKDQLAITDESWIGEEITLAAGKNGQLQYLKKGSAVMPADISANLVEWGKLNPNMMNLCNTGANINMISNAVNNPEITIDVENFLNVQSVSQDTLPQLEKLMDKKIDTFAKQLNASIRKYK